MASWESSYCQSAQVALLNDTAIPTEQLYVQLIPCLVKPYLAVVVDAADCSLEMAMIVSELAASDALLVFPGDGAKQVLEGLKMLVTVQQFVIQLEAKRRWLPGGKPEVSVIWPVLSRHDFSQIILVDDVVSSGATALAVKKSSPDCLQSAQWKIVSWLVKSRSADALKDHFNRLWAAYCFEPVNGDLAINSVSTLLCKEEVRNSFAQRRTTNPEKFLKQLQLLQADQVFKP